MADHMTDWLSRNERTSSAAYFAQKRNYLKANPVFMYYSDRFQKPYPFRADVAVAVDDVFEQKLDAVDALVSQVYEGGAGGSQQRQDQVPREATARRAWLVQRWNRRQSDVANRYREALVRLYGTDRGKTVRFAEAFELCEYGRRPSPADLKRLFPFFD